MRHLAHPHVILSFSGTEQCAAARVLTRNALRSAVGPMPPDLRLAIETPQGDPALALVGLSTGEGDVLAVGTRSASWASRLVHGSVSRYCVRHARCQVIVVAPKRPAVLHVRQRQLQALGARRCQP
jgi:hypothetical protein